MSALRLKGVVYGFIFRVKTYTNSLESPMKFIVIFLLLFSTTVGAQLISVKPLETCLACSSEPTLTLYTQGKDSKVVLVFIPGGDGYLDLKKFQDTEPAPRQINRSPFAQGLARLADANLTSGKIDVVYLDSPSALSPNQKYPSARGYFDHMIRIESVIRYYKEKTGLPVWLMGHSNGGISLTEFFKYAKKNNKSDLISGIVASAIRSESYFDAPITFPVLFMHHEKDGCSETKPDDSFENYQKVKATSKFPTEFVYVTGGSAEARNPCSSGTHMYYGASQEFAKNIENFILKIYP